MKNTEISRILGDMWKNATDEEKRPYVEKEKAEREEYKVAMASWRKDFEAKQEAERIAQHQAYNAPPIEPPRNHFYGDPYSYPPPVTHPHMHHPYPYGKVGGGMTWSLLVFTALTRSKFSYSQAIPQDRILSLQMASSL